MLGAWAATEESGRDEQFSRYARAIAEGRYIVRKVLRIVDEVARESGLDPLVHQGLIQVLGAGGRHLTIGALAERLDIVPAFASRIANELEAAGLVTRVRCDEDRRVIELVATEKGVRRARDIDAEVHERWQALQKQLDDTQRADALVIFAFFIGAVSRSDAPGPGGRRAPAAGPEPPGPVRPPAAPSVNAQPSAGTAPSSQ